MKTLWGFLAVVSPLIVVPAMAADLGVRAPAMPMKAPPPAPVYNWSGCYIGGGGGYGMFDQEHDGATVNGVQFLPKVDTGGRGWYGTVSGGCDVQFGSFLPNLFGGQMLFGGFADGNWGSIKGTNEAGLGNLFGVLNDEFGDEKIDQFWAAGARLGWLPTDRFLTYISGGYTNANLQGINFAPLGGPVFDTLPSRRVGGWFIGAGYEYQLGWAGFSGLTWKTEYRWNDYGSRTDTISDAVTGLTTFQSNSHLFVQTITSQLIWRFNWGGPGTY
jgi:outer membrane immunogenic protein